MRRLPRDLRWWAAYINPYFLLKKNLTKNRSGELIPLRVRIPPSSPYHIDFIGVILNYWRLIPDHVEAGLDALADDVSKVARIESLCAGATMDELGSYGPGRELKWAVSTALSSVYETGDCGLFDHTAEQFVEDAYGFIVAAFEEEGLNPPTKAKLVKAVRKAQAEGTIDWIFDVVLEGGEKLFIAEEQWDEICRKMRLAKIEPPSRTELDREISRRLK